MSIIQFLINKKIYWKSKDRINKANFYLNSTRYSIDSFKQNCIQGFSNLFGLVRIYIFQLLCALVSIIIFQYIDEKFLMPESVAFGIWESMQKIPIPANTFYIGIAAIFGTIAGIYFATVSIVASTSYKSSSKEIRSLIWKENVNKFYFDYLVSIIIFTVIIAAINDFGYKTGNLLLLITLIFSLFGVFGFIYVSIRLFDFLSPINLIISCVFPEIKKWIVKSTVGNNQWRVAEIQDCYRRNVEHLLSMVDEVTTSNCIVNDGVGIGFSEGEARRFTHEISVLIYFYSYYKQKIPVNSRWYKVAFYHKRWFTASSADTEIALQMKISLLPAEVPDRLWLEKRLIWLLEAILKNTLSEKNIHLSINLLNELEMNITKVLETNAADIDSLMINKIIPIYKEFLKKLDIDLDNTDEHSIENKVALPLSVIDCFGKVFVSTILSYVRKIQKISSENIQNNINNINWMSEECVYNFDFPEEVVSELLSLQKKIRLEICSEGERISPNWYLEQLIATACLKMISNVPQQIVKMLNQHVVKFCEQLITEKNNFTCLELIDRGLECCSKAILLADCLNEKQNELKLLLKVEDIYHHEADILKFKSDIEEIRKSLVESFSRLAPLTILLPTHSSIPDYFGRSYWFIAQECIESIVSNDDALFAKLFPMYFNHAFLVYSHFLKEYTRTNQQYWIIQNMDILLDILAISGYALVYRELGSTEIWASVDATWKNYISSLGDDSKNTLKTIAIIASNRSLMFTSSARQSVRFSWQLLISRDLHSRDILRTDSTVSFHNERKHSSDILELLYDSVTFGSWFYDAENMFVANYLLSELPPNSEKDFGDNLQRILRALARLRGNNNDNN